MLNKKKIDEITKTAKQEDSGSIFACDEPSPGLLVAYSEPGSVESDRLRLNDEFTIGRDSSCMLHIRDSKVSTRHAEIRKIKDSYWIEDLASMNGTYVQGERVDALQKLPNKSVIRIGQSVLVFLEDSDALVERTPFDTFDFVGDFYASRLINELRAANLSPLHILLGGPSGAGKELAARALVKMSETPDVEKPFVVHNAARFSSAEEATSTIFGIAPKVFSGVNARAGLIELAKTGTLFLDEVHNLPEQVQRSLLRIIEDGNFSRIGETKQRPVDTRFIFASNAPAPTYNLVNDLLARLRVVPILALSERAADIPTIFNHMLRNSLKRFGLDSSLGEKLLNADHYEAMCLDGFPLDNVRGIIAIADKLATYLASGYPPFRAVARVFSDRFAENPIARRGDKNERNNILMYPGLHSPVPKKKISHYEQRKDLIIDEYRKCGGNVTATERNLRARGIKCSNRWLAAYLKRWGIR